MSKVKAIGLIVEDSSDYNCLVTLIKRITNQEKIKFKKVVGNGCGKIKKKSLAWSENLYQRGCNVLILVQDLDKNDLTQLRADLNDSIKESPISAKLVCIPIEELEAWLIADHKGIKQTFNLKRLPKFKGLPETINSPKEKLRDEIYHCSNKNLLYITKHNERIAKNISIEVVENKCSSFKELSDFVMELKF